MSDKWANFDVSAPESEQPHQAEALVAPESELGAPEQPHQVAPESFDPDLGLDGCDINDLMADALETLAAMAGCPVDDPDFSAAVEQLLEAAYGAGMNEFMPLGRSSGEIPF